MFKLKQRKNQKNHRKVTAVLLVLFLLTSLSAFATESPADNAGIPGTADASEANGAPAADDNLGKDLEQEAEETGDKGPDDEDFAENNSEVNDFDENNKSEDEQDEQDEQGEQDELNEESEFDEDPDCPKALIKAFDEPLVFPINHSDVFRLVVYDVVGLGPVTFEFVQNIHPMWPDTRPLVIPHGADITIVSSMADGTAAQILGANNSTTIIVESGGRLTIDGVNITGTPGAPTPGGSCNSTRRGIIIEQGAELILNSGSITGIGSHIGEAQWVAKDRIAVTNRGTFIMNGGAIIRNGLNRGAQSTSYLSGTTWQLNVHTEGCIAVHNEGLFIFAGGEISQNTNHAVLNYGTFHMSGGEISQHHAINVTNSAGAVFEMDAGHIRGFWVTGGSTAASQSDRGVLNEGSFIMRGGSISRTNGGVNNTGDFSMYDGLITTTFSRTIAGGGVHNTGTFVMHGGTVSNNIYTTQSGAVTRGGGVRNFGTFEMRGGTISGNRSSRGSGVSNLDNGIFIMYGGSITGNENTSGSTSTGAGVLNARINAGQTGGRFYMHGGTISENKVSHNAFGGGVSNDSVFIMTGGEIKENDGGAGGGGVHNTGSGTFTMRGGSISNNRALQHSGDGGGVYNIGSATFNLEGGQINGNTALLRGGGIFRAGGTVNITGGMILNNRANGTNTSHGGGGIFTTSLADTAINVSGAAFAQNSAASGAREHILEMGAGYPNITWLGSHSLPVRSDIHLLNNYDINYDLAELLQTLAVKFTAAGGAWPLGEEYIIVAGISAGDAVGADMPAAPTNGLNTFVGWNTEISGAGSEFSAQTSVNADIEVFAQWENGNNNNGGDNGGNNDDNDNNGDDGGTTPPPPTDPADDNEDDNNNENDPPSSDENDDEDENESAGGDAALPPSAPPPADEQPGTVPPAAQEPQVLPSSEVSAPAEPAPETAMPAEDEPAAEAPEEPIQSENYAVDEETKILDYELPALAPGAAASAPPAEAPRSAAQPPDIPVQPGSDYFLLDNPDVPLLGGVPLYALFGESAWALVNLILTAAGITLAAVYIIRIAAKRKLENDENSQEDKSPGFEFSATDISGGVKPDISGGAKTDIKGGAETDIKDGAEAAIRSGEVPRGEKRRRKSAIITACALSGAAAALFVFTQDMRSPMVLVDFWTILHTALIIGEITAIKAINIKDDQDDDILKPAYT